MRDVNESKISVIVPVYKVEPYLRRCLDSITNQTHENLEIILVDDGSPDNCGAICDEYATEDRRIQVIHKENEGVASARNAGLDAATGGWVGFVDADDWIEPDMFRYLLEGAMIYNADIAICGMRKVGELSPLAIRCKQVCILTQERALQELLEGKNMTLSCCDKLARRALWENLRFSDLRIGEDFLAMGYLFDRAHTVVCLPEIKYNYLTRPESALTSPSLENQLDCWRAAIQQYETLSPKWPQLQSALAGRSTVAAIGIWGSYLDATKDTRRKFLPEIESIAAFCRSHYKEALTTLNLGPTGRITLRVTPYATWWAFGIAWVASRVHQLKHKRPL